MTAKHNYTHERELWDSYAMSIRKTALESEPVFRWTQYPDHGPGIELLGDNLGSVLELGCGTGLALAHLAQLGIKTTGIDISPAMVKHATEKWGPLGARFICEESINHLKGDATDYDAIYSVFGAAWFADPTHLFPLVAQRLNRGGVFTFSQPPAIPGAYGPQGMYKGGFAGPAMFTYRYSYPPKKWEEFLSAAGFSNPRVRVLDAPEPGYIGTLIGRAVML
ncbi:class I SAM-dependent DNA methyltransferase [Streptomyces alkaliphilus]|uniref:class I SAM-dependent DNA methyltransferase n=1 Tax=Streptomyces alkaliphilus TaxID=1472722 RepID=UPI00118012E4|nr:class I SAM-dependent methyltransferase [Streptomyces alkaliphilus]MQS07859.1 methyltransferase domain-containing protein [Streptomyces alkaliphilus]